MRFIVEYEVQCVTKESDPDYPDCRSIAVIGIEASLGVTREKTPAEAYDKIDDGHEIFVKHNGNRTRVMKAKMDDGTKYVKTEPNDTKDDNLLKQDACPA